MSVVFKLPSLGENIESGEVISQDCDTCHSLLAYEEEDPAIIGELNP